MKKQFTDEQDLDLMRELALGDRSLTFSKPRSGQLGPIHDYLQNIALVWHLADNLADKDAHQRGALWWKMVAAEELANMAWNLMEECGGGMDGTSPADRLSDLRTEWRTADPERRAEIERIAGVVKVLAEGEAAR